MYNFPTLNYGAAEFWVTLASLIVAIIVSVISFVLSKASLRIAENSLGLAEEVAEREQRDWRQRKWFDLYFEGEHFTTLLERFQTIFDRPSQTLEYETAFNEITFAARKMLVHASVFPQNPALDALFKCIEKWKLTDENMFSKQMRTEYGDAIESLRQEALVHGSILLKNKKLEGNQFPMEVSKSPWFERLSKLLALPGFLLALFSVGWQVHIYKETHEESPMVRGSLTQEVRGMGLELNKDKHGKLEIEVTNLGRQTMQVKSITLSGWGRTWNMYSPSEKGPTVALEPGHGFSAVKDWNYSKYPVLQLDESLPADFLVEVETARAVHKQHVNINSIILTSTVPTK